MAPKKLWVIMMSEGIGRLIIIVKFQINLGKKIRISKFLSLIASGGVDLFLKSSVLKIVFSAFFYIRNH